MFLVQAPERKDQQDTPKCFHVAGSRKEQPGNATFYCSIMFLPHFQDMPVLAQFLLSISAKSTQKRQRLLVGDSASE